MKIVGSSANCQSTTRLQRQSARMSKITHDGLTRSGTWCFIAVYAYGNSGRQILIFTTILWRWWFRTSSWGAEASVKHGVIGRRNCDVYLPTVKTEPRRRLEGRRQDHQSFGRQVRTGVAWPRLQSEDQELFSGRRRWSQSHDRRSTDHRTARGRRLDSSDELISRYTVLGHYYKYLIKAYLQLSLMDICVIKRKTLKQTLHSNSKRQHKR